MLLLKLNLFFMPDLNFLESLTIQVRRDILRMVHKVNSGHPGGSLGCAELFVVLYFDQMEFNLPFSMDGKNEDLFFKYIPKKKFKKSFTKKINKENPFGILKNLNLN